MITGIINKQPDRTIDLDRVSPSTPIFARKKGKIVGMVVKEERGWILRIGGDFGACGYSRTRRECLEKSDNYEFVIEE